MIPRRHAVPPLDAEARDSLEAHLRHRPRHQAGRLVRADAVHDPVVGHGHEVGLAPAQLAEVGVVEAEPGLVGRLDGEEREGPERLGANLIQKSWLEFWLEITLSFDLRSPTLTRQMINNW